MLLDTAKVRPRGAAKAIETVGREHRLGAAGVARARLALDEPIQHESVDESRHPALAEDHLVGELAHADPPIGCVGDGQERVVLGEGKVVLGTQLFVEPAGDAGMRDEERTPRVETVVACGDRARVGAFGDGHRSRWYTGAGRCRNNDSAYALGRPGRRLRTGQGGRRRGWHHRAVERSGAPDAIVIGGGIIGVSAAAHLAGTGRRVTLVERAEIAAGASGRNSGVVQHPFDPVLVELHLETVDLYRNLDGFAMPATPAGLLSVTHDVDGVRQLTARLVATHPGLRPRFVDPDEMRTLEPTLAPGVAACRLDIGYPVGPAAATRAYAARAERDGVEIRVGGEATLWRDRGRIGGVSVDGARMPAGDVLVAAGPWTPSIVDPSGGWRPIVRRWGVVVPVALEAPPSHVLEEAEISIEPGADGVDANDEAGHAFSLVTADGVSSLGSTFLAEEPDPITTVPALVRRGTRFVPAIADARLGPARLCARPLSLDGRPLVGRVAGVDRLWVAAGHGPWGISTGPASGRLVADLIDGRIPVPPSPLDPARFGAPPIPGA